MNADIGLLLDRLNHIDMWEGRDPERAHRGDVRLSRGLVRTLPGRIAVATQTQKDATSLDVHRLLEPLIDLRTHIPAVSHRCVECDTEFPPKTSPKRKYCVPCGQARAVALNRAWRKKQLPPERVTNCVVCNKVFSTNRVDRKYCGKSCLGMAKRARARESCRASDKRERTCPQCSTVFSDRPAHAKYCSRDCVVARKMETHRNRPCPKCGEPLGLPRAKMHPECRKNATSRTCKWCKKPLHTTDARRLYHPRCLHARNYVASVIENGHESADMDAEFMQWHRLRTRAQRQAA